MTARAAAVTAEAEERLAPLERASNLAWWEVQVDATDENADRRAAAELAWSDALADRKLFAAVEDAVASEGARSLELLRALMLPQQVSAELRSRVVELEADVDARFSRHRGVVSGDPADDTTIKKILRRSDSVEDRREAWEASKTVGAVVAEDVRRLARLRNEAAREVGYRDWFALSLAMDELDEERLAATLAETERVTAEPFLRWKRTLDERLATRFGCAVADLRPWHYADPFFQETPPDGAIDLDPLIESEDVVAVSRRTMEGMGLDVERVLARSDLYPRDGKSQHAFCVDIDRGGDVRVLANVVPTHEAADTMLHELGHAVYDLGFADELPWLQRTTHLVATEATAIFFGSLAWSRGWLERVLGVEPAEAEQLQSRLRAARAAELAVFSRWVLVMTTFERALYADSDGDLDSTWWELVSRYQGVTPPAGRSAPDWAAKIHIALSPVYYHTYLYGAIVALQLRDALESELGGVVDEPALGPLLRERLFCPGESVRWDRLVEQVTGGPISVAALERELAWLDGAPR